MLSIFLILGFEIVFGLICALPSRLTPFKRLLNQSQLSRWSIILGFSLITFIVVELFWVSLGAFLWVEFGCPSNSDNFEAYCVSDAEGGYGMLRQEFWWQSLQRQFMPSANIDLCFTHEAQICQVVNEAFRESQPSAENSFMSLLVILTSPLSCGLSIWFNSMSKQKRKFVELG
jgi:hypothetical protein